MHFFVLNNNYDYTKYFINIKIFFYVLESSKIVEEIKLFYYFEIIQYNICYFYFGQHCTPPFQNSQPYF